MDVQTLRALPRGRPEGGSALPLKTSVAVGVAVAATVAVTPGSFDYAKSVELSTAPVEPAITAGAPFQFGFAATDSFGNTLSETAFGALDVTVEAKKDGETFPGSTAAGVVAELAPIYTLDLTSVCGRRVLWCAQRGSRPGQTYPGTLAGPSRDHRGTILGAF